MTTDKPIRPPQNVNARRADTTTPLRQAQGSALTNGGFDEQPIPDPPRPAAAPPDEKARKPLITLSTTVQHRGRVITISATDITVDRFCDLLDSASYAAPAPAQWQTLPDGTPLCPKHSTPMKLRNKQGDEWWSHRVFGPDGEELWCKGYHGKDSPGYDL